MVVKGKENYMHAPPVVRVGIKIYNIGRFNFSLQGLATLELLKIPYAMMR